MLSAAERRWPMVSSSAVACGPARRCRRAQPVDAPNPESEAVSYEAIGLLGRVLLLPRILDVGDRVELHIDELAVLHLGLAHVDVLDDVAGRGIDRDRAARAVGGLPVAQELDRLVAG